MTDLRVQKRNEITGTSIRMYVRNVQRFDPSIQALFVELEKATDYPKQTSIDCWGERE